MSTEQDIGTSGPSGTADTLERLRLDKLDSYHILDTDAEAAFDRITELAASFYQSPISLISLVDADRQWFKSRVGLAAPQTPRNIAFCNHAIRSDNTFIVPDTAKDDRFVQNPLVTGEPKIRFYAGAPLITHDGYRLGTLCVIDNKPRHEFTATDAKQLRLLADIVISEMELKLKNHQLEQSNDHLNHALQAKKDFMSMMSHEIRNPLGAIVGLAEALGDFPLSGTAETMVKGLQSSSKVLMGLLNDILDYAKIEAGKIEIHRRSIRLETFVDSLTLIWSHIAQEKGLELDIHHNRTLPKSVQIDELRLSQVINNLISNAIKFTHEGRISVSLTADCVRPNSECTMNIEITDTGIGMTQEQQARLFQPFEQADMDTGRKYGGTGLGLHISHTLVTLMNGTLSCTSQPDVGSTFTVRLPVGHLNQTAEPSPDARTVTQADALSILAVDDVKINLTVATHILTAMGHTVQTANSGTEAIARALETDFDLILMDVYMPDMTGLDATREILATKPGQIILSVTADTEDDNLKAMLAVGQKGRLIKPLTVSHLSEAITAHVLPNQTPSQD